MAREFRPVDRDTPMLLPPDLRDWLPAKHLAWLVIEVIQACDLSSIEASFKRGGVGRQAYDPRLLTTVLVYAYSVGVRSSRAIERACVTDVAFRVVAAQQRPDHTTIARFRAVHAEALAGLFGQVLAMCSKQGMGRVGVVSIDGTKIAANASSGCTYAPERLRKIAAAIIAEAEQTDAAEDAALGREVSGDELPAGLQPGSDRASRIREALRQLDAEEQRRLDQDVQDAEQSLERVRRAEQLLKDRYARQAEPSGRGRQRLPYGQHKPDIKARERVEAAEQRLDRAQQGKGYQAMRNVPRRNITDPDSRRMHTQGGGFVQGYNAQLAVSDDHLILATDVTDQPNDRSQFVPMMTRALTNVAADLPGRQVGTVLADAGYCSIEALTATGPDRLISVGREKTADKRRPSITAMGERLRTEGPDQDLYKRRAATVEPVIGHLKDRLSLRRFSRRGLQAVRHELALTATAYNIRRLAVQ